MTEIEKLTDLVVKFRDARNWKQFHNPKDLAISLVLEATEVLEHTQWKNSDELDSHVKNKRTDIADELADVLYWVLLMANDLDINIADALQEKIRKNNEKYPIDKAFGKNTKYTDL